MYETSKATKRRRADDSFPWHEVFDDKVIMDVGSGGDPLVWPEARCIVPFNVPDGGGDRLTDFFSPQFKCDVVHGSNVLEHALDPVVMLQSWLNLVDHMGYVVFTVPDWNLYEKCTWPSRFNPAHQTAWGYDLPAAHLYEKTPLNVLPYWLHKFTAKVLRCAFITTNYDYLLGPDIDQTFDADRGVEICIEVVLQKPI